MLLDSATLEAGSPSLAHDLQTVHRNSSSTHPWLTFPSRLLSSLRLSCPARRQTPASLGAVTAPPSPSLRQRCPTPVAFCPGNKHLTSPVSMISVFSDATVPFCRICREENTSGGREAAMRKVYGQLISPCLCDGSLKYVHEICIQNWVAVSQHRSCELCQFVFHVKKHRKPLTEWSALAMPLIEKRRLMCSIFFYVIAMTCVLWSLYVLIGGVIGDVRARHVPTTWQFWTKIVVILIGLVGGGIFTYIQARLYYDLCIQWYRQNQYLTVLEPPLETMLRLRSMSRCRPPR